nr:amidohydrolase family protein [Methylomonas koyamae]
MRTEIGLGAISDRSGGRQNGRAVRNRGRTRHSGVHASGLDRSQLPRRRLVKAFPKLRFVIAHAGVQCFAEILALARRCDNVFVDTSSHIATAGKIRQLCAKLGAGKLIFGSDIPVMCGGLAEALTKIDALTIPASEKAKILGGNLLNILPSVSTPTR